MTRRPRSMTPASSVPPSLATAPVVPLADLAVTWRFEAVAKALGVSRRTLDRERSAGRFPPPALHIGRIPLWRPETIRAWVEGGGCS